MKELPPSKTLYLIDISSFIFRAFYAIRTLTNRHGEPTNAIYGVATMLTKLIEEAQPEHLVVAYDSKEPSKRKERYADYKANRSAPPEDLIPQFDRIEQLVACLGIHSYRKSGIEADDLIATLAKQWRAISAQHQVVIVTGDKDLMQLVDERGTVWDTMSGKRYGSPEVEEKFGVKPSQIRDYLALVGDSSDNIPGVSGIGPKGAVELLQAYGTLDGILEAAQAGKISGKKGQTLAASIEVAHLSQELATVDEAIELKFDPEKLRFEFRPGQELFSFLSQMDFKSLAEKWALKAGQGHPQPEKSAQAGAVNFKTILSEADFSALLETLSRGPEFGFDLETTSLNPREAKIVGIALSPTSDSGYYIPLKHQDSSVRQLDSDFVLNQLKPLLEDPKIKKIGQNLKYDWSVLYEHGIRPLGIGADTMVAAYVLEAEGRHNLATLARQYLDYEVLTYEAVCGQGASQISFDQVSVEQATRYSAEDAWIAHRLWKELQPRLEKEHLIPVFATVDLPLVDVLCRMELSGVCIDADWLAGLSDQFAKELKHIEERVHAYVKGGPVNLNSPKQLAQLLFEELKLPPQSKTKTGFSTDARVLEALAPLHEVPRLLLEHREIAKLKGTYVDPLPLLRDAKTGKIHAGFHQTVAATGRLSSSDPNLQNIPVKTERGRSIRRAFIPCPGNALVSADYSQIELRLLAHMSGDAELTRSFQAEEDVHARTASEIYGVGMREIDDNQRAVAKAINFGLMYGKTAFGLSQELKIPRKEAQAMIERYFERYSGVKSFLQGQIEHAKQTGAVETLLGRRRKLPDIRSANPAVRANAERMAMNTPIQGTAADLMKLAMIELDSRLSESGLGARMIIQVHDEVVLDCPKHEVDRVISLVCEVMENAMQLNVPLKVNASSGENWAVL